MILQDMIGSIVLAGVSLVGLIFLVVISQAGKPADEAASRKAAHSAGVFQAWLFVVLLVGFVGGSWATLRSLPIPVQTADLGADQVVEVLGGMWYWVLTPDTVPAGSLIEFRVTSADVNHGFGIYGPEGHLLTQTQAMPEYTNRLLYTFDQPGTYTVHCLEYCGIGHAPMKTTFQVTATGGN